MSSLAHLKATIAVAAGMLASCSQPPNLTSPATATRLTVKAAETTLPASISPTIAPQPLSPTSTSTTPAITFTPSPLPPHGTTIADIIRPTAPCHLPCWRGIVPGRSSREQFTQALRDAGVRPPVFPQNEFETSNFFLQGTSPPVETWISLDRIENDIISEYTIWLNHGTSNSGALEVASLDALLGTPDSISYSSFQGQSLFFNYPSHGVLVEFGLPLSDPLGVCLGDTEGVFTILDFYIPYETPIQLLMQDPVDWARAMHVSTSDLWHMLQDGSRCIMTAAY